MSVSFDTIPGNLRVPFFAVEFNGSAAQQGPALLNLIGLIIGQKTSSGTGTANTLHKVTSADQVVGLAGRGSMLHRQALAWFKNNKINETWILILADNGAGVAAIGNLSFTGPATAAGTLAIYLGGNLVSVGVASGDSATTVATNAIAAINAATDLPVTAVVDGTHAYQVNITFRHKGAVGNAFDLRVNYQDGEATPAGLAVTVTPMATGATNPTLTSAIAALGDRWFHCWTHPYTDAGSLTAIETELLSRFGGMRMIDGVAFTSAVGDISTLTTLGETRNSGQSSIMAQPGVNPLTPPMEFAAACASQIIFEAQKDPARPLQTVQVQAVLPPAESDLFDLGERNGLLFDGIGTTKAGPGGVVQLERPVTTYQKNASGSPDTAYFDVTTMFTLMYLRYSFRSQFQTRYPRHKLADDGTRAAPGQAIMTPKLGKAEAIAWFTGMETLGLVQNADDFKANLVVARSLVDPNRLEFLLPPTLIGKLIVGAAQMQFRL